MGVPGGVRAISPLPPSAMGSDPPSYQAIVSRSPTPGPTRQSRKSLPLPSSSPPNDEPPLVPPSSLRFSAFASATSASPRFVPSTKSKPQKIKTRHFAVFDDFAVPLPFLQSSMLDVQCWLGGFASPLGPRLSPKNSPCPPCDPRASAFRYSPVLIRKIRPIRRAPPSATCAAGSISPRGGSGSRLDERFLSFSPLASARALALENQGLNKIC